MLLESLQQNELSEIVQGIPKLHCTYSYSWPSSKFSSTDVLVVFGDDLNNSETLHLSNYICSRIEISLAPPEDRGWTTKSRF